MKSNRKRGIKKFSMQSRRGFTLVELVIAITIIGILSTAAIPRALRYVDQSKISSDSQTANSYESSIEILLASGDLRMNSSVVGSTSGAAVSVYFANEDAANVPADFTGSPAATVENLSGTASLDIYFGSPNLFSDRLGNTMTGEEFAELFEANAKLSEIKYYDGIQIYLDENGASGHEFIGR